MIKWHALACSATLLIQRSMSGDVLETKNGVSKFWFNRFPTVMGFFSVSLAWFLQLNQVKIYPCLHFGVLVMFYLLYPNRSRWWFQILESESACWCQSYSGPIFSFRSCGGNCWNLRLLECLHIGTRLAAYWSWNLWLEQYLLHFRAVSYWYFALLWFLLVSAQ